MAKLLKQVWKSHDGKFFETESECLNHERRIALKRAVEKATFKEYYSRRYHECLGYRNEVNVDVLVNCLLEEGMGLYEK